MDTFISKSRYRDLDTHTHWHKLRFPFYFEYKICTSVYHVLASHKYFPQMFVICGNCCSMRAVAGLENVGLLLCSLKVVAKKKLVVFWEKTKLVSFCDLLLAYQFTFVA